MRERLRDSTVEALIVLGVLTVAFAGAIAGITIWLVNLDGGTVNAAATVPAQTTQATTTEAATTTATTEAATTAAATTAATTEAATTAGGQGDAAAGKQVFASAGCGSCHTLADAGTNGAVGPNLDDAKPSFDRVVERVTHGKGAMPAFGDQGVLDAQQIQDVAAYVSQATGG